MFALPLHPGQNRLLVGLVVVVSRRHGNMEAAVDFPSAAAAAVAAVADSEKSESKTGKTKSRGKRKRLGRPERHWNMIMSVNGRPDLHMTVLITKQRFSLCELND